jgi:hypothetical protein
MSKGKETIARGMCIKTSVKLNIKLTHENVSRGIKLVNLLKLHSKSLFSKKLLSQLLELLEVMIDNHRR